MDQKDTNKDLEILQAEIETNQASHREKSHHHHHSGEHGHHHSHQHHSDGHREHRHHSHHHRRGHHWRKFNRFFRELGKSKTWQIVFLGVTICLFVGMLFAIKYVESKPNLEREKIQAEYKEQQEKNREIQSAIDKYVSGIVCWGDSLTYSGYPEVLKELINEKILAKNDDLNLHNAITVSNEGVWGETSAETAARCGAIPYVVSKNIYIPEDIIEIPMKIGVLGTTNNGKSIEFTKDVTYQAEIEGIEGYLKPASNQVDGNYHVFIRKKAGEAVSIKAGTIIHISKNQRDYTNQIPVVFMGENGGWDNDPYLLIDQINAIVDHTKNLNGRYIVVGLHTGSAESRKELEAIMSEYYGENYVNLREYICTQGYEDLGITPTEEEIVSMKQGVVPSTLLVDGLHYGGIAKKMVATAVFNRMNQLGYFDEVCEAIDNCK